MWLPNEQAGKPSPFLQCAVALGQCARPSIAQGITRGLGGGSSTSVRSEGQGGHGPIYCVPLCLDLGNKPLCDVVKLACICLCS